MARTRRITQVIFFLFFIFLFLQARFPYSGNPDSDLILRFSPLIPLFDFIAELSISSLFWPALIILFATIFLGRFFCSWICPLGTTLDLTDRMIKLKKNKESKKWEKLRNLKFAVLISCIILAAFSIHIWGYFDPLSIMNRVLTVVLYPLFTIASENILLQAGNISFIENPAFAVYDWYKEWIMPENQAHLQQVFWIGLLFVAILALEKVSSRFWCRYVCPAGALLGFLAQFRFEEYVSNLLEHIHR